MTLLYAGDLRMAVQVGSPVPDLDQLMRCALDPAAAGYPGGTVYLLHMLVPYHSRSKKQVKYFQHYTGKAAPGELASRLKEHGTPAGSRCMLVAAGAGIDWILARTWEGARERERQLKIQGSAKRLCPACGISPRYMS